MSEGGTRNQATTESGPRRSPPNLAYLWGEDAYGIERGLVALAAALGEPGTPLQVWHADADTETAGAGAGRAARLLDRIAERVGTAPLFGGGTLVVVRQPGALLAEKATRERLLRLAGDVPPGNGLAFSELVDGQARRSTAANPLRDAVVVLHGTVREYPALTRERMERFAEERATELGLRLGPGAARLLAERVGAYVREGDVDRRRQAELASGELEKLALYRPGGTATREDVAELVGEAVPGSAWAFLDAVGERRAGDAAHLAEQLLAGGTVLPVLISQLHRRLRELIVIRDHLAAGTSRPDLVRILKLHPGRAGFLVAQAGRWDARELDQGLEGLLELDLASKGIPGHGGSISSRDEGGALALQAWIAGSVVRAR
ncbi:MAG: DNA polymerase III subunit delta [Candidatus Limnocylindrales bacterium]